jgi:predicted dehydrogenase
VTTPRRAGLIGAGRIADLHATGLRAAGIALAGVVASTPDRSAAAADRLAAGRPYATVEDLVTAPDIDVVHVASPSAFHAQHLELALEAGKPVVCEKPMTTSLADAERLVDLAERRGAMGTVAFTYRFQPAVIEGRRRIAAGELGPLVSVDGRYLQDWMLTAPATEWRLHPATNGPSRAWNDIGSHLADLVEHLTGSWITAIAALQRGIVAAVPDRPEPDDGVSASIALQDGAIGSLLVSQVAPGHVNDLAVEVMGERGSLRIDLAHSEQLWSGAVGGTSRSFTGGELESGVGVAGFEPRGGFDDLIHGFAAFIRDSYALFDGAELDHVPTLTDGLRAARLSSAVREATTSRTWASVDALSTPTRGGMRVRLPSTFVGGPDIR